MLSGSTPNLRSTAVGINAACHVGFGGLRHPGCTLNRDEGQKAHNGQETLIENRRK
jgi:hypothetical protein